MSLDTIKILHLEPSDVCQAACPQCARETDISFNKDTHHHLSVSDIKRLVPENTIVNLEKMFMCGNYGDPAANKDSLNIFSYFREVNPNIVLGMNTNGGLQNTHWWTDVAKVLCNQPDYVVFSIDGLGDTNHIYRQNVSWNLVMRNAEAFINAGGNAQWDMLVYEHNEHQVDECEKLARSMGFKWFRAKVSKRPSNVEWLKQPKGWKSPIVESTNIVCSAQLEESIYIDARGDTYQCCWLGLSDNTIDKMPEIQRSWNTNNCNPTCKSACGTRDNKNSFTNQWQRETQLC
jgi:MoaA/NifB/PqqE/SkfB family radical SAM enzyme